MPDPDTPDAPWGTVETRFDPAAHQAFVAITYIVLNRVRARLYTATRALDLIAVDYEVLPHVVDLESAMAADAPVLHEHVVTTGLETASRRPSNVCSRAVIANGDAVELDKRRLDGAKRDDQ